MEHVRTATGGRGVDVVLEMAGGDTSACNFEVLAPFGRVLVYGNAGGGQPVAFDPKQLVGASQAVIGFLTTAYFNSITNPSWCAAPRTSCSTWP